MARTKQTARFSARGAGRGTAVNSQPRGTRGRGRASRYNHILIPPTVYRTQDAAQVPTEQGVKAEEKLEQESLKNITYDVTYETSFYAHYFTSSLFGDKPHDVDDTFVPKLSLFQTTPSTLVELPSDIFLGINFTSKYDGDGIIRHGRPRLNFVIALDISGSMSEAFDEGSRSKLSVAKESILSLVKQLQPDDYFGLIVFNSSATSILSLSKWSFVDQIALAKAVSRLKPNGGTSLQEGVTKAREILRQAPEEDNRYSRICFLTDMEAWQSGDEPGFILNIKNYADEGVYTTIVGVGMDLTRTSVVETSRTPGCNYCNVRSDETFRQLMDQEFPYLVTPIGFNIQIELLNHQVWQFAKGYGSPELSQQTSDTKNVHLSSEFATSTDSLGRSRSGCYVFSLKQLGITTDTPDSIPEIQISIRWEDAQGISRSISQCVSVNSECFSSESFSSTTENTKGLRKSILLIRYTDFVQNQLATYNNFVDFLNSHSDINNTSTCDIPPKPDIGALLQFISEFEKEKNILQDDSLQGELEILHQIRELEETLPDLQSSSVSRKKLYSEM